MESNNLDPYYAGLEGQERFLRRLENFDFNRVAGVASQMDGSQWELLGEHFNSVQEIIESLKSSLKQRALLGELSESWENGDYVDFCDQISSDYEGQEVDDLENDFDDEFEIPGVRTKVRNSFEYILVSRDNRRYGYRSRGIAHGMREKGQRYGKSQRDQIRKAKDYRSARKMKKSA